MIQPARINRKKEHFVSWLQQRWKTLIREAENIEPQTSSRSTRVQRLEVNSGIITAQVADRAGSVCQVKILWPPLNDAEWKRIIDLLGAQALFSAQLLAGDFPAEIEQIFEEADLALLPDSLEEWRVAEMACSEEGEEHTESSPDAQATLQRRVLGTVYHSLGEMFNEDPWLLLYLRGRNRQQILQALRDRRHEANGHAPAAEWASIDSDAHPPGAPLDQQAPAPTEYVPLFSGEEQDISVDAFWGAGKHSRNVQYFIEAPGIDRALLRRLGPPPFATESMTIYDRLSAIYEQVSSAALSLAYATDESELQSLSEVAPTDKTEEPSHAENPDENGEEPNNELFSQGPNSGSDAERGGL